MPSYFFTVDNDLDATEVALPDDRTACSEAAKFCGEFIREMGEKLPSDTKWQLKVRDESSRTVAVLTFTAKCVPDKKHA